MPTCRACGEEKGIHEFHIRKDTRLGRHLNCKLCHTERCRLNYHNSERKFQYRGGLITNDEYNEMYSAQNGQCAICGKSATQLQFSARIKRLCVDHDHTTGKVRALLCTACNQGIGLLRENIDVLTKAISYIKKHTIR